MGRIRSSEEFTLNNITRQRTAHLAHDIRESIFVVKLGLEVLKGVQIDSERLAALIEGLRLDGIRPLHECLTVLLDLLCKQHRVPACTGSAGIFQPECVSRMPVIQPH